MTRSAGGTRATVALTDAGVAFALHAFDPAPGATSYGEQAVSALEVDGERVFKTLVTEVDGRLVVAVVPVPQRLDLKALAAAVGGKKARMADPADAERSSGYVVGGISPFGQRRQLPTVLDESALGFATILVSAGRRDADVELAPADLVRVLDATVAAISR